VNIDHWRGFFGWCTMINLGLYLISAIPLLFMIQWASELHAGLLHVDAESVRKEYFSYLANYKLLLIVFNLVPYAALRIMCRRQSES